MVRCPAHDDHKPSLSVGPGDRQPVVFKCQAGCPQAAVLAAVEDILVAAGIPMSELMPERRSTNGRHIVATYAYCDGSGAVLFETVRYAPKGFKQRHADPQNPRDWIWNIMGVRRVLYHLPELIAADPDAPVYVVEGEKDVHAVEDAGGVATCNPMGAGSWRADYAGQFPRDRDVVVVADCDERGNEHARTVAASLEAVARSVRIVQAKTGKDAADHLAAGFELAEFVGLDGTTTKPPPAASGMSEAETAISATTHAQPHTSEMLLAIEFLADHGSGVRFVYGLGWHIWNGSRWRPDTDGAIVGMAWKTVERLVHDAAMPERVRREAQRYRSMPGGALRWLEGHRGVVVPVGQLDPDGMLLGTPGGTLDLRTGQVQPADPSELITRQTGCDVGETVGPEWLAFVERALPDADVRRYVQMLVGAALVVTRRLRHLPIFCGAGANGKSAFVVAMLRVLGDYAQPGELSLLMHAERRGGATPELANLRGARAVFVSESPENDRLNVGRIKALTGGEEMTARHLYGQPIRFRPTHTIILSTNHAPRVDDPGPAIWDRLVLIRWDVVIPADERIPDYGEELAAIDGPGILRWVVDGALAYIAAGYRLDPPKSVRTATDEYRAGEDAFATFLAECTVDVDGASTRAGVLLTMFNGWRANQRPDAPPLNDQMLRARMTTAGYKREIHRGRVSYLGLDRRTLDDGNDRDRGTT